eukprot:scaffold61770_cov30-Tisochrysis_lutea.AAC.1
MLSYSSYRGTATSLVFAGTCSTAFKVNSHKDQDYSDKRIRATAGNMYVTLSYPILSYSRQSSIEQGDNAKLPPAGSYSCVTLSFPFLQQAIQH